ncbi:MAG: CapA family protein [Deltaproteobacteria bacterium]|nr:CapA family protein [Deltaproteobacteria bacterium]
MSRKYLIVTLIIILFLDCRSTSQIASDYPKTIVKFEVHGISRSIQKADGHEGLLKLDGELSVSAVGDIIPHQNVKKSASHHNIVKNGVSVNNDGYDYLFEKVSDKLKSDITIANFESPIAPSTGDTGRPFVFNSEIGLLRAASRANINVFNIANNHIYDQGIDGFVETLKLFNSEKVMYMGFYSRLNGDKPVPLVIEKNGMRVAIFGFTTLLNNLPDYSSLNEYVRKYDNNVDIPAIEDARGKYDVIIVYIHWGQEYLKEPDSVQREIASQLVNAGADIVIGGHPHVLQTFELMASDEGSVVPVIFSMGNFISNQSRNYFYPISPLDEGRTRDSAILRFKIKKYSFGSFSFCVVSELYFVPLWTHNNNIFYSRGLEKKLEIYVLPIFERIDEIQKGLKSEQDNRRKKQLLLELENLLVRLDIIKSTLGAEYVRY